VHAAALSSLSLSLQNVPPKAGTSGGVIVSQTPGPSSSQGGSPPGAGLTMLLPFLILVPFLYLQFRRQKKEQTERAKLKKGDRVVSQSGLVGELLEMDERFSKVSLAKGMPPVQMLTSTLSALDATEPAKKADDLKDLKDAKATADKTDRK